MVNTCDHKKHQRTILKQCLIEPLHGSVTGNAISMWPSCVILLTLARIAASGFAHTSLDKFKKPSMFMNHCGLTTKIELLFALLLSHVMHQTPIAIRNTSRC